MLSSDEFPVRDAKQVGQASHQMLFVTVQSTIGESNLPKPLDKLAAGIRRKLGAQLVCEFMKRMGLALLKGRLFDQCSDFTLVEFESFEHGPLDDASLTVVDAGIGHGKFQ